MSTTRILRLAGALLLLGALVVGAAALAGCGSSDEQTGNTAAPSTVASASAGSGEISVIDGAGDTITMTKPAQRIVSLAPANTEIAYAVGAGDKMVAGTSYDDYPEEAKSLPKIGDFANPSVEKIASFDPDLVLATGGIQDKLRTKLEDLGMTVYVVDPKSYADVETDIENIGMLAGTSDQAQQVANTMIQAAAEVTQKVGALDPAGAFLEIYSKPLMTAGSDTFINDMITIAGGKNIGAEAGSGFPQFSTEVLVKDDPQVYIADSGSMAKPGDIKSRPGFADLTAVKDGRVYVISDSLVARPGPRLADGLRQLAQMIHPEAYTAQ
jgi:iron complex transport system substrate-binding protein